MLCDFNLLCYHFYYTWLGRYAASDILFGGDIFPQQEPGGSGNVRVRNSPPVK